MNGHTIVDPEDDLQTEAERIFGIDAYVITMPGEFPNARLLGYLEQGGELYDVVLLPGTKVSIDE